MEKIEADAIPAVARAARRTQPFDVDLGTRIRALRVAAGMSQAALGEVVGVSFQQVQKYELAKDRISAATLVLIATALNVPVGSFFEGSSQSLPARSGVIAGDKLSAKIVVLFQQIDDPSIRKHFVALAAALADVRAGGTPETVDGDSP